ncbi:uncharacterized protein LOC117314784 [Pecten maximus]|uniref:uncharacterized protein LOC117314784 n=1 Tax=Pecten maximus TaxID=6579 RepID=UPI0014584548|nr:uncharacterized protein LOC117314784 [Pecten maximus]
MSNVQIIKNLTMALQGMVKIVSFTFTVCMAVMMGAAKPAIRNDGVPVTSLNSTGPLLTGIISNGVEAGKAPSNTTDMTVNCTNTKSVGEAFSCFLEGYFESIFVGVGFIILLLALFVLLKKIYTKTYRNERKTAEVNTYENKKMIPHHDIKG